MILVLGTPDPVAIRLVELLVAGGQHVTTFGNGEIGARLPPKVQCLEGDSECIDFGVSGEHYRALLSDVDQIVLADATHAPSGNVERSRLVRQAAEVVEFVRAGGARDGVRFLSSLLVFGDKKGAVSEDELQVGQGFRDEYEECLAVAEKLIQSLRLLRPLSIVRTAPIVGDDRTASLFPDTPLARLVREIDQGSQETGHVFTDLPTRFETVERAALALERLAPTPSAQVAHLVDEPPWTDRQLIAWLAARAGKQAFEVTTVTGGWSLWTRATSPGSHAIRGWALDFARDIAVEQLSDLLDRDLETTLLGMLSSGEQR